MFFCLAIFTFAFIPNSQLIKMANSNLTNAKNAKNDEFYTQYQDIEKEITVYLEYNPII